MEEEKHKVSKVYIMAQGEGSRWEANVRENWIPPARYKQLVPIGNTNEVIISRTINQLHKLDVDEKDITVICPGYFLKYLPVGTNIKSFREPVGSLLNGIWQTSYSWPTSNTRVLILLGDVVFSNYAIAQIVYDVRDLSIYGRRGGNKITDKAAPELFGIGVCKNISKEWIVGLLFQLWKYKHGTKLWHLYSHTDPDTLVKFDDYSDDCDSPQEYQQFWSKLEKAILEDDERL